MTDFLAVGEGAFGFVAGAAAWWAARRAKKATEATKVSVEASARDTTATDVLHVIETKLDGAIATMATKDSLVLFAAQHEAFKSMVTGELAKLGVSNDALATQFDKLKAELKLELAARVTAVEEALDRKLADLAAKIPAPPAPPLSAP